MGQTSVMVESTLVNLAHTNNHNCHQCNVIHICQHYHQVLPSYMNTEEVEAMEPNAWIDFRPEQAFAPSHCDAWTEVAILRAIRLDSDDNAFKQVDGGPRANYWLTGQPNHRHGSLFIGDPHTLYMSRKVYKYETVNPMYLVGGSETGFLPQKKLSQGICELANGSFF